MPNWVINKVKPKKDFDKVAKFVCGTETDEDGNYREFDFEKILPCPKSLHITSGGGQECAIQYALKKKTKEDFEKTIKVLEETKCSFYGNYLAKTFREKKSVFELLENSNNISFVNEKIMQEEKERFEKKLKNKDEDYFDNVDFEGLGIRTYEDFGNTYINNIIKYGADTWYDWNCENWGSKWNTTNPYIDNDTFVFETAWSCPLAILQTLSKKFSDIEFEVKYADEDIGSNCGSFTLLNGVIDNEYEGDKEFAYEMWNYTDEMIQECENYDNEEE